MSAKHTPGPWVYIPADPEFKFKPAVQRGKEGGFCVSGLSPEREAADACLIAAAPEQREALIGLLELVEELDCLAAFNDPRAIAARAAIAKAEGQQ